ncbi:phosphate acetyltransferase [Aerococcus mictus]|uniref:phosphate acetyltransferase n=1 Tax=Aerococcus mictus TaxID=2976810 RepID=UPI00227B7EDD|nr:phosphate acetyltransferase [Aerococcus mictus]MCY3075695.1 phosphate acetyltransferase [Aerococcus mictus]
MALFDELKAKIKGKQTRIVFPEATDERIQGAAARLKADDLLVPILVGNPDEIHSQAKDRGIDLSGIEIVDPDNYDAYEEMVQAFVERRKGKATEEQAREMLKDVNYFGTMLVYMGKSDGLVSGAAHATGDTVRPALQIIKTKAGVKNVSGAFLLTRPKEDGSEEKYMMGDCAITISPDAETLAEIGLVTGETAKLFDVEPDIAFLSFSTKGSASSPEQEKAAQATKIAQENAPEDFNVDGELQFDAALVPAVGEKKAPGSKVAGHAKVLIFPEIQSGNIGYKIAQRLGGFEAIGPILQEMAKPVNDLSRGCNEEDAYKLAIVTALQAGLNEN